MLNREGRGRYEELYVQMERKVVVWNTISG